MTGRKHSRRRTGGGTDARGPSVFETRSKRPKSKAAGSNEISSKDSRASGNWSQTRSSDQRDRDFLDACSDWLWELDREYRISYLCDRFAEATGIEPEAVIGKTWEEANFAEPGPEAWKNHLGDMAARRSFRDFRHLCIRLRGERRRFSISGKAIFDESDRFAGYRGGAHQLSAESGTEAHLRNLNDLFDETERLAKLGHWEWDEVENRCT